MSKSSASSISVLLLISVLIFEVQLVNGAQFLRINFLSYASLFGFVTITSPLTVITQTRS